MKKIYFKRSHILLFHDTVLAIVCFLVSWLIRFVDNPDLIPIDTVKISLVPLAMISVAVFTYSKIEKSSWRYATEKDYIKVFQVVILINICFFIVSFFTNRLEDIPRSLFLINTILLSFVLLSSRILYKFFIHLRSGKKDLFSVTKIPVIVAGLDDKVELFLRSNYQNPMYDVLGIVDNAQSRKGNTIYGIKILGQLENLDKIYKQIGQSSHLPKRIIVSDKYKDKPYIDTLVHASEKHGTKLALLPNISELDYSFGEYKSLRPIIIEDLLLRDQTLLNAEHTYGFIKGAVILITGAGGSIGSELTKQIANLNPSKIILIENCEYNLYRIHEEIKQSYPSVSLEPYMADIRNKDLCSHIFAQHRPALVFHAAALKHVPIVESNVYEGIYVNIFGTKIIADLSILYGVKSMVLISTDKAVRPTSMLGATKRMAEMYIKSLECHSKNTKFTSVRFGNVLGSSGSVIPLFEKQIREGGPVTVTDPLMKRYFMTIKEAVSLVLQASAYAMHEQKISNLYILDMGEQVYIKDLAKNMIEMSGLILGEDIQIKYTGLRPGEKLFEELFNDGEKYTRVSSNKFFTIEQDKVSEDKMTIWIKELESSIVKNPYNKKEVLKILKRAVPDYNAKIT